MAMVEGDSARARALAVRARELGRRLAVVSLEMFALSVEGVALVNEGEVDGRHALPRRGHRRGAGGRVRGDRAGGVDLLPPAQRVRAGARLRARRRVVQQGRGVRPQDEDQLRHGRLPGALRRRAHLAGALAGGRAGAHRGDRVPRRADGPPGAAWASCGSPSCAAARGASPRRRSCSIEPRGTRSPRWCWPSSRSTSAMPRRQRDLLEPVLRRVPAQNRSLRAAPVEVMVRAKAAAGEAEAAALPPRGAALDRRGGGNASAARRAEPRRRGSSRRPRGDQRDGAREARGRRRAVRRERRGLRAGAGAARARAGARRAGPRGRGRARGDAGAQASRRDRGGGRGGAGSRAARGAWGPRRWPGGLAPGDQLLTPRELEVLRLVSEGLTDGEIAARLVLSKHTVHRHLQNAYAGLGCSSRASAVAEANRLHLL